MKFELFKDKSKWLRNLEPKSKPVIIKEAQYTIPEESEDEERVCSDEPIDVSEPPKASVNELPKNPRREFQRVFRQLTRTHRAWDVWRDFIVMCACAFSNSVDKSHYDTREKRYLKIINSYDKADQELFPQLVCWAIIALDENPEQDFLGEIFMELGLGEANAGQFFTPYHVCELMADLTESTDICKIVEKNGYATIHDSCCGAGATLIAGINRARKQLSERHWNFQDHILIVAQDVDEVVALMCYIQISLLGVAGFVKVGNTFTDPIKPNDDLHDYWFTPMYFNQTWVMRRILHDCESALDIFSKELD